MNKKPSSVIHHLRKRQIREMSSRRFQQLHHVDETFINRLGLEHELEGHNGCVNCLEWNDSGTLLGTGSDDLTAVIWDPHRRKKLTTIVTGHLGNIFSLKFLPNSQDETIATGAADYKVRVHNVPRNETCHAFSCHAGRVKRLAVVPNLPYMFWSAGEDGTIRQFDLRSPHVCSDSCNNVLINLNYYIGKNGECKCLAINPFRPEQLAVGASDPYIRLYDIRMLNPHAVHFSREDIMRSSWRPPAPEPDIHGEVPKGCVQYFIAGHLPVKEDERKRRYRSLVATYVTFGPTGRELLANLGGEQVYLFDIYNRQTPKMYNVGDYLPANTNGVCTNGVCKEVQQHVAEALSSNGTSIDSPNGMKSLFPTTNGRKKEEAAAAAAACHQMAGYSQPSTSSERSGRSGDGAGVRRKSVTKELPPRIEVLKHEANKLYCDKKDYTSAIRLYNQAISLCPDHAILYGNRAAAYMKRGWDGDIYAALRDCHSALTLDTKHRKAHFRLARCLLQLTRANEAYECLQTFKTKFPEYAKYTEFQALERDINSAVFSHAEKEAPSDPEWPDSPAAQSRLTGSDPVCAKEKELRNDAFDYTERFCGHCNTTTDIKEANFFGSNGQYIMAGSDDGSFFIWDRKTTNIVRVLRGDDSIVNCLQPHPSQCLLATSGIDPVVRLWSPRPQDGSSNDRCIAEPDSAATANQRRMKADPLEVMLMNMGYRITGISSDGSDEEPDAPVPCRPS
ncbi:WD and tetratricopeptide repeats protein 1-like [Diadema antillarum]|uniref:WD and tetratricopeptide repeats protein 1-like n=1 Tax=Diadema antillarum TaxID=105358 RepID=UPI003A850EEE